MRTRTKAMVAIALFAVVVMIAASCNVYLILARSGGTLLWNSSEAYFFIGVRLRGYQVSYLRYPWFLAKNYLGGIEDADDDRESLTVVRVTPAGVEQHVLAPTDHRPGNSPGQYTPRQGHIYANYPALGGLCVWAGDHFEAATHKERQGFDGIDGLTEKDFDNGWSKRGFGDVEADSKFTVEVGDKFGLAVNNLVPKGAESGAASIDLLRPGKASERIWGLDLPWRKINKVGYQRTFQTAPSGKPPS